MAHDTHFPSPFRQRDFCVFWTGCFLSGIGSQFTTVAMAWQIYELTNSPLQIGLLGLARAVPQIVLLLVAGLLADAMNRCKLMMCTQIGLSCVSAGLVLLTLAGKASPQMLYVATMLLALFTALEQPSRQSIIPHLVPRESLAQALALQGTQRHVPNIAGPSLADLVLALFGPAACYMVDAISWLAMLSSLALLRTKIPEGGRWILMGIGVYGISTVLFAGSHTFWFSVLMLAISGASDTISSVLRSTINQLITPDELRRRMSSINSIFTSSGPQLGQFESGIVAAWLGAEASALTGGLATLAILAAVAAVFPNVRRFSIRHQLTT